jgi:2-aminoadipate transaminase
VRCSHTRVQPDLDWLRRRCAADDRVIALSGGLPSSDTFPSAALARAFARVAARADSLQYTWPEGREGLRRAIAVRLAKRGLNVGLDEILITSGAQQALDIAVQLAAKPGQRVAVGAATYPAALELFRLRGLRVEAGLTRSELAYVMPVVENPTGLALEPEARSRALALADFVLEDDAYADLSFHGPKTDPLVSSARERVFYVGTFSKTLCPGLRVGFLMVPQAFAEQARSLKQATDLQSNGLSQALVESYLECEDFDARLAALRVFYSRRRDRLLAALRSHMPSVRFQVPAGGFSVWVETDFEGDEVALLAVAAKHGVSFDPGCDFRAPLSGFGPGTRPMAFRLTYSSVAERDIEAGVCRLQRAFSSYLGSLAQKSVEIGEFAARNECFAQNSGSH